MIVDSAIVRCLVEAVLVGDRIGYVGDYIGTCEALAVVDNDSRAFSLEDVGEIDAKGSTRCTGCRECNST